MALSESVPLNQPSRFLRVAVSNNCTNRFYPDAGGGTIYGMSVKTTIYLPEDLKKAVENEARRLGQSEAEVIRHAITQAVARPRPRGGLYQGEPIAETSDELLSGFGER